MDRRDLMREAACVAGAWAAGGAWPVVAQAQERRPYARSRLVDHLGEPIKAASVRVGEAMLFRYPYLATPAFLVSLGQASKAAALTTQARHAYEAPPGVGPRRSLVAFSAICAHKLVYPTPQHSFIGLRKGGVGEPVHLIHCCSDNSRYDPSHGARVIGGPAPQPLAAVLLEWDTASDELHAVGTQGGELFQAFFDKYAFRLEMELGTRARALAGATTLTQAASVFSRQWQSCSV